MKVTALLLERPWFAVEVSRLVPCLGSAQPPMATNGPIVPGAHTPLLGINAAPETSNSYTFEILVYMIK